MIETLPRYRSFFEDSARWEGFEYRPGDIVISTPPKCGTTWMQRICSLLIFQTVDLDRPLTEYSPWLDMLIHTKEEVFRTLAAQSHRRFIKTHTPLDGLPADNRVTYVCVGRDPRDAAISMDYHGANMDMEALLALRLAVVGPEPPGGEPPPIPATIEGRFWRWVDEQRPVTEMTSSLRSTLHHYEVALKARDQPNVVVLHYADLKADLAGEMRRLARRLAIDIPEPKWPSLVEAATFDSMRQAADRLAPEVSLGIWKENRAFFRGGKGGDWRSFFDDDAQRRYDARVADLTTPDIAYWAHNGSRMPVS